MAAIHLLSSPSAAQLSPHLLCTITSANLYESPVILGGEAGKWPGNFLPVAAAAGEVQEPLALEAAARQNGRQPSA